MSALTPEQNELVERLGRPSPLIREVKNASHELDKTRTLALMKEAAALITSMGEDLAQLAEDNNFLREANSEDASQLEEAKGLLVALLDDADAYFKVIEVFDCCPWQSAINTRAFFTSLEKADE